MSSYSVDIETVGFIMVHNLFLNERKINLRVWANSMIKVSCVEIYTRITSNKLTNLAIMRKENVVRNSWYGMITANSYQSNDGISYVYIRTVALKGLLDYGEKRRATVPQP